MYVLNCTISGFESEENGILVCRPLAVEAIQRPFPAYFCSGRSYNDIVQGIGRGDSANASAVIKR